MGDGNFEIWEIVEENAKALADRIPAIGQTSTDYERLIHEAVESCGADSKCGRRRCDRRS